MFVPGVTQGQTLFLKYSLLCDIIASTCFISCVCSLLSLALVTLHHHVIIFNSWLTDLFEGHKYHGLLCLMCWVISIIAELPNFLISYFNEQQCMWGRAHNRSYTMFTCILLIATPLVFILISHVKIVAKVFREDRKARIDCYQNRELNVCTEGASMAGNVASPDKFVPRNAIVSPVTRSSMFASTNGSIVDIQELNTDVIDINGQSTNVGLNHPVVNTTDEGVDIQSSNESSRPAVITTAVHRARRLDTTLMVMAIAYLVCWIPVLVVNLADVSHQMPIVFLWVSFLAHCHAFVACIAYMMTNSHFIRAFKMRSGCSGATISPPEWTCLCCHKSNHYDLRTIQ